MNLARLKYKLPRSAPPQLIFLLLLVAIINFFTMPKFYCAGDNFASRGEAIDFLKTGTWGLDYSKKAKLGDFLIHRGAYLFENDTKEKLFSKYGVALSLAYLPPLILEKIHTGHLDLYYHSASLLFFINLFHILLALVSTVYFYKIVSLYTQNNLIKVLFILASYYTTYLWYYLRTPAHEIYQVLPFLAFYYHFIAFLRGEAEKAQTWRHLVLAIGWTGLLLLMKFFYALLFGAIWLFAFFAKSTHLRLYSRWRHNLSQYRNRYMIYLFVPTALYFAILLGVNFYKFGSILELGYGQWVREDGTVHDRLSFEYFLTAFQAFVIKRGNANLFLHYPLMIFACFGIRQFFKKYRFESLFIYFIFFSNLFVICFFSVWSGEWCYGPRYLLQILMIGSLPMLTVAERLRDSIKSRKSLACIAIIFLVLGLSLKMQIHMNGLRYFTYYYTQNLFATFQVEGPFQVEEIDDYFTNAWHRSVIHGDLLAYRRGQKEFPPLTLLEERLAPQYQYVIQELKPKIYEQTVPNYFLFSK